MEPDGLSNQPVKEEQSLETNLQRSAPKIKRSYAEYQDSDFDPSQIRCTRRQPRRFVHSKPFSNGLADHAEWLREHFYTKPGSLVPKGFLCARYEEYCQTTDRKPMNNATLGRFIRGVFRGLETRRLGARQQSRYFYNNLAVRPSSPYASAILTDSRSSAIRCRPHTGGHDEDEKVGKNEKRPPAPHLLATVRVDVSKLPRFIPSLERRKLMRSKQLSYLPGDDHLPQHNVAAAALRKIIADSSADTASRNSHTGDRAPSENGSLTESAYPAGLLRQLDCHMAVLAACFVSLEDGGVEAALYNFWATRTVSVQCLKARKEVDWDHWVEQPAFQSIVRQRYFRMFEEIMITFLPDILQPVADVIWAKLWLISRKFPKWMEKSVVLQVEPFRQAMMCDATAFSGSLKDRLILCYASAHVDALLSTELSITLCNTIQLASQAGFLAGPMELDRSLRKLCAQGLLEFARLAKTQKALEDWRTWFSCAAEQYFASVPPGDSSCFFNDWTVYHTQLEADFPTFSGSSKLIAPLFLLLHSIACEFLSTKAYGAPIRAALASYQSAVQEDGFLIASKHGGKWAVREEEVEAETVDSVPSFDLTKDTFFRTFECLKGIVYPEKSDDSPAEEPIAEIPLGDEASPTSSQKTRVSGRRGKGRHRQQE